MPVGLDKPDTASAVDFLQRWEPEGPWALTCISPDRKGIETRTFHPSDIKELEEWLDVYNGQRNLYFHVNPPIKDITKKAERTDIKEVRWLHVDIDPRTGEDLETERARALGLLEKPPDDVPVPNVIVFSGGGYQGFWKLEEPIPVDGNLEKAEAAKLYNMQLERVFAADNCHNIDRIMRLPGTVNIPDERKIRKGRVPTLAKVVSHTDTVFALSAFKAAPEVVQEDAHSSTIDVPEQGVERLKDIDELDHRVANWCKILIVQGKDPDQPNKYPSRSEAIFAVVCELIRANVSDTIIYSVLTDPRFAISARILEKGSNARGYAIRQIQRAKEEAIEPWLRKLNEQHAIISDHGGRCVVISEMEDPTLGRTRLSTQTFEDFRNRYLRQTVDMDDNKTQPVGHWWLKHRLARQYDAMVFAPGQETKGNLYNLWRGFSCEARPGDCSLFLEHIKGNLCRDDEDHYDYLMKWMARCVQKPSLQGETAIVLRGAQGTGKSFFAKTFGSLWGRHFMAVADAKFMVGSFNAHLRDTVVLFGDEAFYAGDKKHEGVLKTLVTEETLASEAKYRNMETVRNCLHLIMASNSDWVIPAGIGERRFFVLDVSESKMQNTRYFQAIKKQMDNGGREAFLHLLQNMDLKGYNIRNAPKTSALQDQKQLSMDPLSEWIICLAQEGRLPGRVEKTSVPIALSQVKDLHERVIDGLYPHARSSVPRLRNESNGKLGRALRSWGCEGWTNGRQRGWKMPTLMELRKAITEKFGEIKWHHPEMTEWDGDNDGEEDVPF